MSRGWFVTGTDTGVGKTTVAECLIAALNRAERRVAGMKPVASGCAPAGSGLRSDDALRLQAASSIALDYADVNPYAFEPAVAPHLAARAAAVDIDIEAVGRAYRRLGAQVDWIVVEGVGGWRVPIGAALTMADVARRLDLPVILVVGIRLGCLNHALLTAEAIARDGLSLAGWVANRVEGAMLWGERTRDALVERLGSPLAELSHRPAGEELYAVGEQLRARLLQGKTR